MAHLNTLFAALLALGASIAPAAAQTDDRVLCTGLGEDERAEAETFKHNLKLVYAAPDGKYLGEVGVLVTDGDKVVYTGTCDGPWLLLDLAPGSYRVTSDYRDQSKVATVQVGGAVSERTILFDAQDD